MNYQGRLRCGSQCLVLGYVYCSAEVVCYNLTNSTDDGETNGKIKNSLLTHYPVRNRATERNIVNRGIHNVPFLPLEL